jgi:dihydrodipicolinate reductase
VFAAGAVAAAKFIFEQKTDKLYTMEDMVNTK